MVDFDLDGTIAVKNGVVQVTKPKGNGKWPVVSPGRNVIVYYDNQLVKEPTVVFDESLLQIIPTNENPVSNFEIKISPDKSEAVLITSFQSGSVYKLKDSPPSQRLVVRGEKFGTIQPAPLQPELVYQKIKQLGIKVTIIQENVVEACRCGEDKEVVIAKGQAAVPPVDGKVEYTFSFKERIPPATDENNSVDFYYKGAINSVEAGTVLARWTPPRLGKPGRTIFNEEIKPPEPKNKVFNVGEGVQLIDDGRIAVATIDGRPHLVGHNSRLVVIPMVVVEGDVNINTGHIDFNGDVMVFGDVSDGLKISAGGRVEIKGNVYHAEITAGSDVVIHKKVIGTRIRAGGDRTSYLKMSALVNRILPQLPNLVKGCQQLETYYQSTSTAVYGEEYLIKLLLDLKFSPLARDLKEFYRIRLSLADVGTSDALNLLGLDLDLKSYRQIEELRDELAYLQEEIKAEIDNRADVRVDYCQNSEISATGSIEVTGELAYNSTLSAGKQVSAKVLGCETGSATNIKVGSSGTVNAYTVYPNVNLRIGFNAYLVPHQMYHTVFYLDGDEIIAGNMRFKSNNTDKYA